MGPSAVAWQDGRMDPTVLGPDEGERHVAGDLAAAAAEGPLTRERIGEVASRHDVQVV